MLFNKLERNGNDKGEVDHVEVPEYSKNNLSICRDAIDGIQLLKQVKNSWKDISMANDFSEDEIRQAFTC
nr:hypothetical protein [Lachnobacterium bovis]